MDAFAELGLGRDLRVTEEELRSVMDRLSGERHPDAGGSAGEFAQLREAYAILRSPGRRLRHWLELGGAGAAGGVGVVPGDLLGYFEEVGGLLQRVEGVGRRKAEARSALGRSVVEREQMVVVEELGGMMDGVAERVAGLEGRFAEFEERGVKDCAGEAREVAAGLAYLEKWRGQLREAWVGLAV